MTQSQTYTLAPVIGSALSGHLDFQCGDIVISVDHLLTTTAAGTKGAGIVQPTAYTHQITAVVKYPDGTVAPLIDRSYDLSLPDWPVTSKGIGALKWDTDILPEPGIKWRYLVDEWTCEAAE